MIKLSKSKGFSLVELMIVVAIMAILAAIAIPSYLRFQIKGRESEMRINLAAVRTCEEAYKAESDVYLACGPSGAYNGAEPVVWAPGPGFDNIGFEPDGMVRYTYEVAVVDATKSTAYTATAKGSVDGDANEAVWTVNQDTATPAGNGNH